MKASTLTTRDEKVIAEWLGKFDAREPLDITGQKYLIDKISSEGYDVTITMHPVVKVFIEPEPSKPVDFAVLPEGTTHVCVKSSSLWRKAANGVAFAWVNACWQQIGALAETWQPIVEATALQDEEKQYLLGTPVKARQVLRDSARLTARRWFEGAALFVPGDYIACNWPRSHYLGRGLNFPCTRVPVEPAQWDGEGLPPVGVDCEVLRLGQWIKCRIFAHRYGRALFDFEGGWGDCDELARFRPIKTAEQLAAEQREAAVRLIAVKVNVVLPVAERIYDAGLRFPEEK